MTVPSYAQPTAASLSRRNPKAPPADLPAPSTKSRSSILSTPKKLKRPSTLTPKRRESLAYAASLIPIHPKDPKKPCPLTLLPPELRTEIWTYALKAWFPHADHPPHLILRSKTHYANPPLLYICRAIRIEAAYTYYTTQQFRLKIRNLDFRPVTDWLHTLPVQHREMLARNRNLHIDICEGVRWSHTYPPKGWLLDDWTRNQWKACRAFGDLYTLPEIGRRRVDFLLFCRLLAWFWVCAVEPYRGMRWRYGFVAEPLLVHADDYRGVLQRALGGLLSVLCRDWGRVWVRGKQRGRFAGEARRMLDYLDEEFQTWTERLVDESNEERRVKWEATIKRTRDAVSTW